MTDFTPEQEAWFARQPPEVASVARLYPPHLVYWLPARKLHARIIAYRRAESDGAVSLVVHAWRSGPHGIIDVIEIEDVPPGQLEPAKPLRHTEN